MKHVYFIMINSERFSGPETGDVFGVFPISEELRDKSRM